MIFIHFGMRRSGNHAFLGWLYPMIDNYFHINDIVKRDLTTKNYHKFRTMPSEKKYVNNRWIGFKGLNNVIINVENAPIKQINRIIKEFKTLNAVFTIIIRNPYNCLACAYKEPNMSAINMKNTLKEYLKELLKVNVPMSECIVIFYDKWIFDKNYRMQIAEQMGLKFNDENIDKVIGYGSSSFEPRTKLIDDKFREKVKLRYKIYENDQYFKKNIMDDEELKILWSDVIKKFGINF